MFRKNQRASRVVRPAKRRLPIVTSEGINKTKGPSRPQSLFSQDKVAKQLADKSNLRLCVQRKLGGLGDVLMTTPTVKALKIRYPDSELTYATDPLYYQGDLIRILEGNPYIDKIIDYRTIDPNGYHLFVDVTGVCLPYEKYGNPPINRIDLFAQHVGIRLEDPLPVYNTTQDEKTWAKAVINKWFGNENYTVIAIHTASVDVRRTWPIENYINLIADLNGQRNNLRFLIFDQNRKHHQWDYVNCIDCSNYAIRQTAALIDAADIFVGPDSGPLHFAGALNKDIVSIFGSTHPDARIDHYDNAIAITAKKTSCKKMHCWYSACPHNLCCMSDIKHQDVLDAILAKIDKRVPIELQDPERKFVINVDKRCDTETYLMGQDLCAGIGSIKVRAELNSPKVNPKDVVIDIIQPAKMVDIETGRPQNGQLNYCFPLVPEGQLTKTSIHRISSGYDGVLCLSDDTIRLIRQAGIATDVFKIDMPIMPKRSLDIPIERLGVITDFYPGENIDAIVLVLMKLGLRLNVYTSNRKTFKGLTSFLKTRGFSYVKPRLFRKHDYESVWENIGCYVNLTGKSFGYYTYDAIARDIPIITGDYKNLQWLSNTLAYKISSVDNRNYLDADTNKTIGSYSIHKTDDIMESLQTVMNIAKIIPKQEHVGPKYIIKSSTNNTYRKLINIVQKRL